MKEFEKAREEFRKFNYVKALNYYSKAIEINSKVLIFYVEKLMCLAMMINRNEYLSFN